ncbi:MAG: Mov34/MPN/PAD-1 family protein [Deltaproteobacteria bacterium]|jgi:proteasome lid subunit RPN8/RPN11/molybdopterin converting factor small subunit|nr:Mov34/MPN/PAD-1 family protein [Deltaproteobacteria bacterium]
MTVSVRLSTTLRKLFPDYNPTEGLTVGHQGLKTVEDLAAALNLPIPEIKIITINGSRVDLKAPLKKGDRVGFFPAIGGGSGAPQLSPTALKGLEKEGLAAYPKEACGFLLGQRDPAGAKVFDLIAGSPKATESYSLSYEELLAAEVTAKANSQEVLGFFHSHPEGEATPSEVDDAEAIPGYVYVILSIKGQKLGEIGFFQLDETTGRLTKI